MSRASHMETRARGARTTHNGLMLPVTGGGCMTCPPRRRPSGEDGGPPNQCPEGRNPASAAAAASAQRPTRGRFLRDRILAIASVNPTTTAQKLLLILINDPELPADTRLAVGRRVFQSDRPRSAEGRSKKSTAHIHRPNQGSPHGKPADQGREPQPRTSTTPVGSVGLA